MSPYTDMEGHVHPMAVECRFRLLQYSVLTEASLRYDDGASVRLAALVVVDDEFTLLFLVNTKTDAYASGQWGITVDDGSTRSVQTQLRDSLEALGALWAQLTPETQLEMAGGAGVALDLARMPLIVKFTEFVGVGGRLVSFPDLRQGRVPVKDYKTFSRDFVSDLKSAGVPATFTANSFRVGSTRESAWLGLNRNLIQFRGRWRSLKTVDHYVGADVSRAQLVEHKRSLPQ